MNKLNTLADSILDGVVGGSNWTTYNADNVVAELERRKTTCAALGKEAARLSPAFWTNDYAIAKSAARQCYDELGVKAP